MTFRHHRPAPFRPRPRNRARMATWFAHLSLAIMASSAGYLLLPKEKDPTESIILSDGLYSGQPEVETAVSLRFGSIPVRLKGIDAPDRDQTCITQANIDWECGETAAFVMSERIKAGPINCEGTVAENGRMILATCYDSMGINLNSWLVEFGWAIITGDDAPSLDDLQSIARLEQRGLWAARFDMPWDWRENLRRE